MEEFDKRVYDNIIQKYTDKQLIYELAIIDKQETNLYSKKRALKEELKRRLENT